MEINVQRNGKSISVWNDGHVFSATVIDGGATSGVVSSIRTEDLSKLFVDLRKSAGDRLAVLTMQRVVRTIGEEIRAANALRKAFIVKHKGDIAKIKAAVRTKKAAKAKVAVKAKVAS